MMTTRDVDNKSDNHVNNNKLYYSPSIQIFFFHCYSNRPGKNGEIETNECQKFISKIDDDDDDNDDDGGCRNVGNDNEYYE